MGLSALGDILKNLPSLSPIMKTSEIKYNEISLNSELIQECELQMNSENSHWIDESLNSELYAKCEL